MQLEANCKGKVNHITHIREDTNFLSEALSHTIACIDHNCDCKPASHKELQST